MAHGRDPRDRGAMDTPEQRLKDLRAAKIVNLPTRRRRNWYRLWAGLGLAAALWFASLAFTEKPLYALLAAMLVLSSYGWIAEARKTTAQLRAPHTASFEEPSAWQSAGADALEGAGKVPLSGGGALVDTALGFATKGTDRLWQLRKPRQLARWQTDIAPDLRPGEPTLVGCRALLVPHGLRRALLPLTLMLAAVWMIKGGFLTVTDRRLLFHRRPWLRRGRQPYVYFAAPLSELEVLQWHEGVYLEARQRVLVMRSAGGRVMRVNIDRVWAKEAQWAFDLVASSSQRPPAFLAARWA